jgi:arylsulfatase A-like enzyme
MGNKLPNIILIVMDTVGAKHCSLYGYHRKTTPHMERIAEESRVYCRCFSPAPWTPPSHASLFTGLYPSQHGTYGSNLSLDQNLYSLPEILKNMGYKTYAITSNGLVSEFLGFGRGFDKFYEMRNLFNFNSYNSSHVLNKIQKGRNRKEKIKLVFTWLNDSKDFSTFSKLIADKIYGHFRKIGRNATFATLRTYNFAEKIIREESSNSQPFFLFINFMQAHMKYNPPTEVRERFIKKNKEFDKKHKMDHPCQFYLNGWSDEYVRYLEGLYDEELLFLDKIIWDIFQLKDENTIFVITGDHGEMFGEHGLIQHLFGLYNELIHVPLIIKFPGEKPAFISDLVQTNDLFATLSEVVSAPFPVPLSSKSLIASNKRQIAISQFVDPRPRLITLLRYSPHFELSKLPFIYPEISMINEDMWKIIRKTNGVWEVYDLKSDLNEVDNLIEQQAYQQKIRKLQDTLKGLEDILGFKKSVPEDVLDLRGVLSTGQLHLESGYV